MAGLPRFDYTWTFGNTMTLIGMFLGGALVYAEIKTSIRVQETAIMQTRERISELAIMVGQEQARVRALELNSGRIDEKLLSINAALERIEAALTTNGGR